MMRCCLVVLLLAGCAASPIPDAVKRLPPATAMSACENLGRAADGTLAEVYRAAVSVGHKYQDCRARHGELIEWVKRGQ